MPHPKVSRHGPPARGLGDVTRVRAFGLADRRRIEDTDHRMVIGAASLRAGTVRSRHNLRAVTQARPFRGAAPSSLSDLNANPLISLKLRILALTKILCNINHLLI